MVPRKETISCMFLNLVNNIQDYNARGIYTVLKYMIVVVCAPEQPTI